VNLKEIMSEVNKDIDDEYDSADLLGWINRGLDDLTPFANYQALSTVVLVPGQKAYPLPAALTALTQVTDDQTNISVLLDELPLNDFTSCGYKVIGRDLVIQPKPTEARTLTLYYTSQLPHLKNPDDVPVIRPDFHDLLVLYTVARARYQDEEESLQINAMSDYLKRRNQFVYEMHRAPMYSIEAIF
jgi:hypothetical protein